MGNIGEKQSVLVAESEADIRSLIREAVQAIPGQAQVTEAEDGLAAEQKAQKQKFDLVIMDVKLPKRSGSQLLSGFQFMDAKQRPSAILILTEENFTSFWQEAYPCGPVSYVKKPCVLDELKKKIETVLLKPAESDSKKISVELTNALIEAVSTVIPTTTSTPIQKDSVFVRGDDQISGDISAVMVLQGGGLKASMAISFDEVCFLGMATNMFKEPTTVVTPEIADLAGEICNQLLGVSKRKLNLVGYQIESSLPSVITGKGHKIRHYVRGPILAVRFKAAGGYFTLETCVAKETPSA